MPGMVIGFRVPADWKGTAGEYILYLLREAANHKCQTHGQWLASNHYMCSCGHVEWAHHGTRLNKGQCAHCNCTQYNGEVRPLTDYENYVRDFPLNEPRD